MADGVDDGDVCGVAIDRVVERVARDVVGRFEEPGDADVGTEEGERWDRRPTDLGGQRQLLGPAGVHDVIAVGRLRLEELGGEFGQLHSPRADQISRVAHAGTHDPEPARAVQDREPEPGVPVALVDLDDAALPEAAPCVGGVDVERRRFERGQRPEDELALVDHEDGDVLQPDHRRLLRHRHRDFVRSHPRCFVEQRAESELSCGGSIGTGRRICHLPKWCHGLART